MIINSSETAFAKTPVNNTSELATSNKASNAAASNDLTFAPPATHLKQTAMATQIASAVNYTAPSALETLLQSLSALLNRLLSATQEPTKTNQAQTQNPVEAQNEMPFTFSNMTQARRPFQTFEPEPEPDERVNLTALPPEEELDPNEPVPDVSGYNKDGNVETFIVLEGEPKRVSKKSTLDPRVESHYTKGIFSDARKDYEFSGHFNIVSAEETTFFQMLNTDPNDKNNDKLRPVLFLEAYNVDDEPDQVSVTIGRNQEVYVGPREFDLKVETNGQQAKVTIAPTIPDEDGNTIEPTTFTIKIDRYRDGSGALNEARNPSDKASDDNDLDTVAEDYEGLQQGQQSFIRYGAYHHDGEGLDPKPSTAKIVVSDAKLKQFNDKPSLFPTLSNAEKAELQLTDDEIAKQAEAETARLAQ